MQDIIVIILLAMMILFKIVPVNKGQILVCLEDWTNRMFEEKSIPRLPDEIWDMVASNLLVPDIVALSMVGNHQLLDVMRKHQPTYNPLINTDQYGICKIWPHILFVTEYPHEDYVFSVFVRGDYLYTGCRDDKARKIDINTGETLMEYPHKDFVNSVFVSGNYLYTGCFDDKARKIDINTGETLMEYPHKDWVLSVFVSGDYLYTGCDDKKVRKIDINTGKTLMEYPHNKSVDSVFVSGEYLYTGCHDGKARKIPL